jgi:putative ABC transport system ATP-binding protein
VTGPSGADAVAAVPDDDGPLLEAVDVVRSYELGRDVVVHALRGVSFALRRGEYVAIVGTSGSGKSTLLNLLGALDRPTSGQVLFRGVDVRDLTDTELAELRNRRIGFVFQSFHLLPRLSAKDNVALPLVYRSTARRERNRRAEEAMAAVGLADRMHHKPTELSGGQQQRVAIARALVTEPDLILADEPTGNLDTATGAEILDFLDVLHRRGSTVVVITHDRDVAARAQRTIELRDGVIVGDHGRTAP